MRSHGVVEAASASTADEVVVLDSVDVMGSRSFAVVARRRS
jgi:hypothetical protein